MNENTRGSGAGTDSEASGALERRARVLLSDSVDGMDFAQRSRLVQARHAAVEAASRPRPWFLRLPVGPSTAGVAAAGLLGVALWVGGGLGNHGVGDPQAGLEDLDIVASSDAVPVDAMEMLQDDLDFYDFADKAASSGPAA